MQESCFIYGYARTPIGRLHGKLAGIPAPKLAGFAIREALHRSQVPVQRVSDLILGNVLSAGLGQAPARQAGHFGGLPYTVHGMLVNKVCGSGLMAVILGETLVRLGDAAFVVAGGMENMSQAPILHVRGTRKGEPETNEPVDSLVYDGLWDSFCDAHMGSLAEKVMAEFGISREDQDLFALESYRRARKAQNACVFSKEIVPVPAVHGGETVWVEEDEQPGAHDLEKLTSLPPVFEKKNGTITAGNASSLNDGAAAVVVGPPDSNLRPLAKITGHAAHSQDPDQFPVAPAFAIQQLIEKWGVHLHHIDLFEINEAFSGTTLAVIQRLGLDPEKVNVHGGAVALGHPIGASGARILVTLLNALEQRDLKRGIAAICIGGGEALALGVERLVY